MYYNFTRNGIRKELTRKMAIVWSAIHAGPDHNPNRWQSSTPTLASMLCPISDRWRSKCHPRALESCKNVRRVWRMYPETSTSSGQLGQIHLFHLRNIRIDNSSNEIIWTNVVGCSCDIENQSQFHAASKVWARNSATKTTTPLKSYKHSSDYMFVIKLQHLRQISHRRERSPRRWLSLFLCKRSENGWRIPHGIHRCSHLNVHTLHRYMAHCTRTA